MKCIKKIQTSIKKFTKPKSNYRKILCLSILIFASFLIILAIIINVFIFDKAGLSISLEDQKAIKECASKNKSTLFLNFVDTRESDCAIKQATLYYYTNQEYSLFLCKTYYPDFYKEFTPDIEARCKFRIKSLIY